MKYKLLDTVVLDRELGHDEEREALLVAPEQEVPTAGHRPRGGTHEIRIRGERG